MTDKIIELGKELAKHRKLLNRAIGNRILPHINYHHYEVVRLIEEIKVAEDLDFGMIRATITGIDLKFPEFNKMMFNELLKAEDDVILRGNFNNFTTDKNGNHNDTHVSK